MSAIATKGIVDRLYIIAIPLTKPFPHAKSKITTYYHFHITNTPASVTDSGKGAKEGSIMSRWLPEGGLVNWVTTKAADTWAGFGRQPTGWKRSLYEKGEKLVDQLDFEESVLKSIHPSLGPTIKSTTAQSSAPTPVKISLLYPPTIRTGPETLRELSVFVSHRMPEHRKGFYLWALASPLTAPISIIPIIPNIPFFFCAWRSWSHYKAYKAAQYLNTLLEHGLIVPEESKLLDAVYDQYSPHSPFRSDSDDDFKLKFSRGESQQDLLLTREAVPNIARIFSLKSSAESDLHRAIEQTRLRVLKGQIKL